MLLGRLNLIILFLTPLRLVINIPINKVSVLCMTSVPVRIAKQLFIFSVIKITLLSII